MILNKLNNNTIRLGQHLLIPVAAGDNADYSLSQDARIAKAQQNGFGAMVSFDLAADERYLPVFFAALRCFTLAQSLGGIESLICHPATMTHASMDAAAQQRAGISATLVRLSVGIEDSTDLVADLQQALAQGASFAAGAGL